MKPVAEELQEDVRRRAAAERLARDGRRGRRTVSVFVPRGMDLSRFGDVEVRPASMHDQEVTAMVGAPWWWTRRRIEREARQLRSAILDAIPRPGVQLRQVSVRERSDACVPSPR
jgi:hypothetical protein